MRYLDLKNNHPTLIFVSPTFQARVASLSNLHLTCSQFTVLHYSWLFDITPLFWRYIIITSKSAIVFTSKLFHTTAPHVSSMINASSHPQRLHDQSFNCEKKRVLQSEVELFSLGGVALMSSWLCKKQQINAGQGQ